MRTIFSFGVQMILFLAVIAALAAIPLFVIYRSQCVEDDRRVDSWSVVAPWDDPPEECRDHENGFEVLREEVGL